MSILRTELQKEGVKFLSETDTEVICAFDRKFYKGDILSAIQKAIPLLQRILCPRLQYTKISQHNHCCSP